MDMTLKDHLRAHQMATELQAEDGPAPDEGQQDCWHGLPEHACYDCAHEDKLPGEEVKSMAGLTSTVDRFGNPYRPNGTPAAETPAAPAPNPEPKRRNISPEHMARMREAKREAGRRGGKTSPIAVVVEIERRTGKVITESVLQALRERGSEESAAIALKISLTQLRTLMKAIGVKRKMTYAID